MNIRGWWSKYFSSTDAVARVSMGLVAVAFFIVHEIADEPIEFLKRLELIAYDTRLKATLPNNPDSRVVIIDIDEKSLQAEGRWPWSRNKMAQLVRRTFDDYGIKVMGFDVFFAEPDTSSGLQILERLGNTTFKDDITFQERIGVLRNSLDYDTKFAEEIKKHVVVLAFAGSNNAKNLSDLTIGDLPTPTFREDSFDKPIPVIEVSGYSANLKSLQQAADSTGHIMPDIDFDGVLRRVPMLVKYQGGYYEALSLAMIRAYFDNEPLQIKFREDDGDRIKQISTLRVKEAVIPLDTRATALVPFRGPTPMFRYISATDILQGKLAKDELKGKLALVGTSAQGLLDLRNVPVNNIYPGVEVHANMLSGFLDNNIKQKPPYELGLRIWAFLILGIPLAFLLARSSPVIATVITAAAIGLIVIFNMYWWHHNVVIAIAMPMLLTGVLYLLNMAYGFFIESRSKKQITSLFGTYIPKELVDEMAKSPGDYGMHGETREMTVLFSDVRNFTSISEGLSATELTAMMNAYLTAMTSSIQERRGTIDKYIGDAIMAFWGAPLKDEKHAKHALLSALDMQQKIKEIAPEFQKRGWPALEIGVGLNCGPMNVGDMGSSFRRSYTVMGDAVNLASRLEGLTKEYGVGILVSENIVKAVTIGVYRELDRVRVKGKLEPISIFEPVGLKGDLPEKIMDELDYFQRILVFYREQRWDDAERLLATLIQKNPDRKLYQLYLKRITNLRQSPPGPNWDGVFTFTTK